MHASLSGQLLNNSVFTDFRGFFFTWIRRKRKIKSLYAKLRYWLGDWPSSREHQMIFFFWPRLNSLKKYSFFIDYSETSKLYINSIISGKFTNRAECFRILSHNKLCIFDQTVAKPEKEGEVNFRFRWNFYILNLKLQLTMIVNKVELKNLSLDYNQISTKAKFYEFGWISVRLEF